MGEAPVTGAQVILERRERSHPRSKPTNMKTHIILITATAFVLFQACDQKATTTGAKSPAAPTGSWIITSKPAWVTSSWLDHRSDTWQFLADGTCILGTATGSYYALPNNQFKVQIPMQAATPGFTAVFSFALSGNALTLNNLAESDPVLLTRKK